MSDEKQTGKNPSENLSKIEHVLFLKIKTVQSLPDNVVNDFLACKGKLRFTDFRNRIFQNVK